MAGDIMGQYPAAAAVICSGCNAPLPSHYVTCTLSPMRANLKADHQNERVKMTVTRVTPERVELTDVLRYFVSDIKELAERLTVADAMPDLVTLAEVRSGLLRLVR